MTFPAILFIGHGASRTGAPISLLKIIKWVRENTNHRCIAVLGNDGPLVDEYSTYAEVHIWNKDLKPRSILNRVSSFVKRKFQRQSFPKLENHKAEILRSIMTLDIGCIFCNTGVTGHILETVKEYIEAPVVTRIPELESYMRKNNRNGSVRKVLTHSNHFIAVSEAVKANLINNHKIPADRISVVYGSCDSNRLVRKSFGLREKLGIPSNAIIVGGCGTLEYHKGIDLFIQAANYCIRKLHHHEIYFCWAGAHVTPDSWIDYEYEIEHLELTDRFFFLGAINETTDFFSGLDTFLLTSREDSFPLVVLEAARQAIPVVCFEGGGGASEFVDDDVGFRVPLIDIERMARTVSLLASSTELRSSLGEAAYLKSCLYTPERMGEEAYTAMRDLMTKISRPVNVTAEPESDEHR